MIDALWVNGDLETGGVLIGNKIAGNHFQIIGISIFETNKYSTFASFIWEPRESTLPVAEAFR